MTRARASRTFETSRALQVQDRCVELAVAKDVLDPAAKVSAREMAFHDIVRQGR